MTTRQTPMVGVALSTALVMVLVGASALAGLTTDPDVAALCRGGGHAVVLGFGTGLLSVVLGLGLGLGAGLGPRLIDALLARAVEVSGGFPTVVLLAVVSMRWPGLWPLLLTLSLLRSLEIARTVRTKLMRLVHEDWYVAARALGCPPGHQLRQLLPHLQGSLLVSLATTAAWAVLLDSSAAYLGLADGPTESWGRLLVRTQAQGDWLLLASTLALLMTSTVAMLTLARAVTGPRRASRL